MSRRTFWYSVDSETRYKLATLGTVYEAYSDWSDQAVEAAEDYHSNHDGWEDHWPVEIELYETEDGPMVALFEVERESVPQFSARKLSMPERRKDSE